jgi:hypothetical protein
MITLLALLGAGAVGWFIKQNVAITTTKDKPLTTSGWKPDDTFQGVHILINVSQFVTAYNTITGWFKTKKEN